MTVERRLHHAARELREVSIDVPELGELAPDARPVVGRSRLAALAAPMLFVAGGVLAVGVMQREAPEAPHLDIPAATAVVGPRPTRPETGVATPSVHEELRMIAGLLDDRPQPPTPPATRPTVDVGGSGPN